MIFTKLPILMSTCMCRLQNSQKLKKKIMYCDPGTLKKEDTNLGKAASAESCLVPLKVQAPHAPKQQRYCYRYATITITHLLSFSKKSFSPRLFFKKIQCFGSGSVSFSSGSSLSSHRKKLFFVSMLYLE